ncbi:MATE family efflux transporter [Kiloniella sp. b19]|uniref:MATE family efflux transporter n=1 Tax=Kiloniella sp. GXU_MW_B19 TaxID=3141326 RepID=UPI0031D7C8EA
MSSASAVGLLAVFVVDLVDLFFLSLLGEEEIAAAVGFAGTVLFFTISLSVGLFIGTSALVSQAIGAGDDEAARRLTVNGMMLGVLCSLVVVSFLWPFLPEVMTLLGAEGRTHQLAVDYLRIIIPTMPLMNIGMQCGAILRSLGDVRRSMRNNVYAGIVNAVLDPILIFGLALGIEGAALATVSARMVMAGVGLLDVFGYHKMGHAFRWSLFFRDVLPLSRIAVPAVLTNLATPLGTAYVTVTMAQFGVAAMAGNAIIARITPLAFTLFYSLSGAVGPIVGQNYGAKRFDRLRETIFASMKFLGAYTLVLWGLFLIGEEWIVVVFDASPEAAELISVFCLLLVPLAYFQGILFLANAAFNNLGKALYATASNIGRATVGTIPFVYLGAVWYGAEGALIGQSIGAAIIAVLAVILCLALINRLEQHHLSGVESDVKPPVGGRVRMPLWPFVSSRMVNASSIEEEPSAADDKNRKGGA